ncbi:hypothetical protein L2E82_21615 [Cichorium intybus]|uniref:Uncharacterized protein n=1 Tax=Cichorium intybus TaxID=13427 RepID=A0ACB9DVN4_CICIN|nr:hypothetical protein L2E82_21615 [Cichorium intybus]
MKLSDLSLLKILGPIWVLGYASYKFEDQIWVWELKVTDNVETYGKLVRICGFTSSFSGWKMLICSNIASYYRYLSILALYFHFLVAILEPQGYRSAAISRKLEVLILPLVLSLGTM